MSLVVSAGQTSSGLVLSSSTLIVATGGSILSTTLGGTASGFVSGGVASVTVASGGSAALYVLSGLASVTTITNGATLEVTGGTAVSNTVSGASVSLLGGTISVTTISATTIQMNNGTADATTIAGGGEIRENNGLVNDTTVLSGGILLVNNGQASATVISAGGSAVDNSGTYTSTLIANGGTLQLNGGNAVSTTVSGTGAYLYVDNATVSYLALSAGGSAYDNGGTITNATINQGGVIAAAGGSVLATVIGSGGELQFAAGATISGISILNGGTLEFASLDAGYGGTVSYSSATETLTVTEGGTSASVVLFGNYAGETFNLTSSGKATVTVACYCPGTLIRTPGGEVPIECLAIGDRVETMDGVARPIRWIGRRSYDGRFAADNPEVMPVRIRADALADGVPHTDLLVSPRHALLLDGLLVAATELVNGVSVVQLSAAARIDYLHLEFDTHTVIFANGAAAESFVDDDSRMMFHNAEEYARLYPAAPTLPALYCAPRIEGGFALEAIRQRLGERAGVRRRPAPLALRGYVDEIGAFVCGWAQNPAAPEVPVCLDVLVNGVLWTQTLADRFRPDLAAAGLGSGRHGFRVALPPAAGAAQVVVRRSIDGAVLPMTDQAAAAA